MELEGLSNELASASLHDLYRVQLVIKQLSQSAEKVAKVRSLLRPGLRISYFDLGKNRYVEAVVLELHRTRLLVQDAADGAKWSVVYAAVNVDGLPAVTIPSVGVGHKSQFGVGDRVSFVDHQNQKLFGEILKLNPKTALVQLKSGVRWKVHYRWLSPVLDGTSAEVEPKTIRWVQDVEANGSTE